LLVNVCKTFNFDAAHKLPDYEGKCRNLHGHTYKLEVEVRGEVDRSSGMVIDFTKLSKIVHEWVVDIYDHSYLNNYWKNPTAEVMLLSIWNELVAKTLDFEGAKLSRLRLWETPTSYAEIQE